MTKPDFLLRNTSEGNRPAWFTLGGLAGCTVGVWLSDGPLWAVLFCMGMYLVTVGSVWWARWLVDREKWEAAARFRDPVAVLAASEWLRTHPYNEGKVILRWNRERREAGLPDAWDYRLRDDDLDDAPPPVVDFVRYARLGPYRNGA